MTAPLRNVTLDDRYTAEEGVQLLSGIQALVRMMLEQHKRDLRAGLNTAGFVSGYRGSPIGGLDRELGRQKALLDEHHIVFQPGVNEELGAMAVWGSQQVNLYPRGKYDGVFGMWYGKGAGVDRSIDVLRHANAAGSAPNSGALAVIGDDHMAKSSSQPHNCEVTCSDIQMPLLYPSNVAEVIEYGLAGFAMSRHSGCWTALKILPEIADSTAVVDIGALRDFRSPPAIDDIHIRTPDPFLVQETRLVRVKLAAARDFMTLNGLDREIFGAERKRLGIVASGKAYLDVLEALRLLGLSTDDARLLGLSLFKVAMPFPLNTDVLEGFVSGHEEILVVEEKRPVIEQQLKDALFNLPEGRRPRVVGKLDIDGSILVPRDGETNPELLASILGRRLLAFGENSNLEARLDAIPRGEDKANIAPVVRIPFYCAGCPHNISTKVPEGSRSIAGIGCHSLSVSMDRSTNGMTVMGCEGSPWIGQSPFTDEPHVFTNMGDGTYYHSGIMPIRAAVAAKVTMTFKILFNDAVAMTGGQAFDGPLTVDAISRQVAAEGVSRIVVVTDEPEKYDSGVALAPGTSVEHRDRIDAIQKELRETKGVSILIYDQTCAAEKRRRRKRGTMVDPDLRVMINERVCEGCGDCSVQSNCIAVEPVETEFGRKRRINQSACNKDMSCLKGFCPSFVTASGIPPRTEKARRLPPKAPDVEPAPLDAPYRILIAGIGGTGIVTASALLAMAAHLEGKAAASLDLTGMAQKGGAVSSHVTIAREAGELAALRTPAGSADVVLAADMVFTAAPEMRSRISAGRSQIVLNSDVAPVGEMTRDRDFDLQEALMRRRIEAVAGGAKALHEVPAAKLSTKLLGDAIGANLLMIGYAYQLGLLPLSAEAIEKAIELNGAAVTMNMHAFQWGRALAADDNLAASILGGTQHEAPRSLAEIVHRNADVLTQYQNAAYAARYRALVDRARQAEELHTPGREDFADAVARFAFKLMAYKDEYEVARLYTDGVFDRDLRETLGDVKSVKLHLAPPLFARHDPDTGLPIKSTYGPWILNALRVLARMKRLRGTPIDPFGRTAERKAERRLVAEYEETIGQLAGELTPDNHAIAVEIARVPDSIRGFGHIKMAALDAADRKREALLTRFRQPDIRLQAAAE